MYLTCLVFIVGVLGALLRVSGLGLWAFLRHIREELFIVLGTSSSESVLPRLMTKLEALGCSPALVRLVVPAGYSFNLDGSCIYLTMGAMFIAQATQTHLTAVQQLSLLAVCLITSKGAAGVTGAGFVTLAATLASTRMIPVEGMVLILGVDRIMSEARALTNLIGNGVATVVIARWENDLDSVKARAVLHSPARADSIQAQGPIK
jgi:aerobic C4-dicarboxylate transport protein